METLGSVIVFFAALFAVLARDSLPMGMAALSVSYALNVTKRSMYIYIYIYICIYIYIYI